ncbi:hypothetical protein GPECTOR_78g59 [Gonium pectorale]|uniref:Guanylate cyclase domain-containing protein n=1 Tax=Gonium pectorale TaxID=33097 RepID=A0A150G236_GONPE|nr:hypothetical protein GPECTOR_78g59 [Gonium pectorale]|eukprot:KXZ43871.1 hypothetical protein GPECTOR_78g59 [Gonium pectorale]
MTSHRPLLPSRTTNQSIVTDLCCRCGGYVVEASEGLCLAAFRHAAAALVWALCSREALAGHNWSSEVRRWYRFATTNALHGTTRSGRGPRPRTGVHVGGVNVEVNAATGRMTYRGKVMNRTSRIAHKAASEQPCLIFHQIVCSKEAWDAVEASIASAICEIQQEEGERRAAAARAASCSSSSSSSASQDDCVDAADALTTLGVSTGGAHAGGGSAMASARGLLASVTSVIRGSGSRGDSGAASALSPPPSSRGMVKGLLASLAQHHGEAVASPAKPGSPPVSGRDRNDRARTLTGTPATQPSVVSSSGMAGRRSTSAKHLSPVAVAAAAAAALGRRVVSFSIRNAEGAGDSAAANNEHAQAAVGPRVKSSTSASSAQAMQRAQAATPTDGAGPELSGQVVHTPLMSPLTVAEPVLVGVAAVAAAAPATIPQAAVYNSGLVSDTSSDGGDETRTEDVTAPAPPQIPEKPPPPPEWQALCRLVGPKVDLPPCKRLAGRFLGKFSLKGVREEMRLFEVFWLDTEEGGNSPRDAGEGSVGDDGGRRGSSLYGGRGSGGTSVMGMLPPETPLQGQRASEHAGFEAAAAAAAAAMRSFPSREAAAPAAGEPASRLAAATGIGYGTDYTGGDGVEQQKSPDGDNRHGVPVAALPPGRSGRSDWGATDTGGSMGDNYGVSSGAGDGQGRDAGRGPRSFSYWRVAARRGSGGGAPAVGSRASTRTPPGTDA